MIPSGSRETRTHNACKGAPVFKTSSSSSRMASVNTKSTNTKLSSQSRIRTDTTTFRVSRPTVRRSSNHVHRQQLRIVRVRQPAKVPLQGIDPRPTVSKTIMHPPHSKGKTRKLNFQIHSQNPIHLKREGWDSNPRMGA